jgi:diguanylate cyclase (GGDEF)-like protein
MAISTAQLADQRHALCYMDLDRFKAVNDACGHDAGDVLLRNLAAVIQGTVPESAWVARLGGDEFAILLSDCSLETARKIAEDVVQAVANYHLAWKDSILNVGVSVGLIEVDRLSGSVGDVMYEADIACFQAKKQGIPVNFFSARAETAAREREELQWRHRLQSVLEDGRLMLETRPVGPAAAHGDYGPGLEVFLALTDEGGRLVAPAEFLSAAERYGLMPQVDRWVVRNACDALGRGAVRLDTGRSLSIRLSKQSLGDEEFLKFVVDCLDRTGVAPGCFCFEVTEDSITSSANGAITFMRALHGMGCRFGVRKFGRAKIPVDVLRGPLFDYLKCDGDLIRDVTSGGAERATVNAIIERARFNGFRLIAEQVEEVDAIDPVVAVAIDWEVEGRNVLHLMVRADGSIQRMGDGTTSGANCSLDIGRSNASLLPRILSGLDPDLFRIGGLMALEPIAGKLCKLTINFSRESGGGNAFEVWYGLASAEPAPPIVALVRNAIEQTNDWYGQLRADPPVSESGWT